MKQELESIRKGLLNNLSADGPSGIVVFLVALPFCLGVALASGAPMFSGIIAGIVVGIMIGYLSGSSVEVAGFSHRIEKNYFKEFVDAI